MLSEFQRQRFVAGGIDPERIEILPNVVPAASVATSPSLEEAVSFVGRVSAEKGIDDFLEAARRLSELLFAVAGTVEDCPGLVASAPPNVEWMGFLRGADLDALYARSRVLVFPSRWFEGFP